MFRKLISGLIIFSMVFTQFPPIVVYAEDPDTEAPTPPLNLSVVSKSCTSITLGWEASTDNVGVTGYDIYQSDLLLTTIQELSYTVIALSVNSSYTFTVKAKDAANNASEGSTVTDSTNPDTEPPTVPQNLVCTDNTETTISISWDASSDVVGALTYDIYRDSIYIGHSVTTSYNDSELLPGTSYSYTVVAKDSAGNLSLESGALVSSTDTDTLAPTAPANLRSTAKTSSSITLAWDASSDNVGVIEYNVYDGTTVVGTTSGATTILIDELTSGTAYSLTVKARDATNNVSEASSALVITTMPGIPSDLSATSTLTSITLTWSPVTGATGYDVDKDGTRVDNITSPYTVNTLQNGTQHKYKVRAKNGSDIGDWSTELSIWTLLPNISGFSVSAKKNSMQLQWNSISGATSYDIEIDGSIVANTTTTSYLHENLVVEGEVHVYRVRGKNDNTVSAWAGPISKPVITYTPLSGTISSNRTLTPEEGPYGIVGDLTIAANVTLTIDPGTLIRVSAGHNHIIVYGKIQANGDELHNINITSMKDPLFGGTGVSSLSDYWDRIEIRNNGEFNGNYVNIYYAGVERYYYYIYRQYNYNICLTGANAKLILRNSKIKYSDNHAIEVANGVSNLTMQIENCTFENVYNAGINFETTTTGTGSVSITNNAFNACGVNISDRGTTGFTVDNNTFNNNDQSSIYITSFGTGTMSVNYNSITNGTSYPLLINLSGLQTSIFEYINENVLTNNIVSGRQVNEVSIKGSVAASKNITIRANNKYICGDYFGVDANGTLTVEQGTWLLFDKNTTTFTVYGKLNVNGTVASPVLITAINDPEIGGTGSVVYWGGIYIDTTGELVADNMALKYSEFYNISCYGKLSVKNSELSHAGRIAIVHSSTYVPEIKFNTFLYNGWCDYSNPSDYFTDLTYNYFGSPYGPIGDVLYGNTKATIYPWIGCESANKFRFGVRGVNSATGNYSITNTDLSYGVPGFKLSLDRYYNSSEPDEKGYFGKGWAFNYESSLKDYSSRIPQLESIVVDGDGNIIDVNYHYITIKIMKTVKMPDGRIITFNHKSNGTYEAFDSRNELVEIGNGSCKMTTPDQFVYTYNSKGYLISMQDRNGNTLTFSYDSDDKLTKIIDQTDRELSFEYNSQGYISQVTDPQNRTTTYDYNADGYLVKVTSPMGAAISYEYDNSKFLNKVLNNGNVAIETIEYTHKPGADLHKVLKLTDKFGNVKTYSYNNANRKTTITDTNGRSTVQEYDGNYTVNKSTDTGERSVIMEYVLDAEGKNKLWEVKKMTDRNNNLFTYERDSRGNITKIINPGGGYKQMEYDDKNNIISQRDEEGKFTYFIFDSSKTNLLKTVQPLNGTSTYDGSTSEGFAITSYTYYTNEYNAKGMVKTVTDPEGGIITYTYDSNGYISTIKNAVNKTTYYTYSLVGLLTEEVSPGGNTISYTYDKNGKQTKKIMEGSETFRTVYDKEGKELKVVPPKLYSSALDNDVDFTYSGDHGTRITYYGNGTIHTVIDAENNATTYTYDLYGNKATETRPDGAVYRYEYDALNRLTKTYYEESASSDEVLLEIISYSILSGGFTQKTVDQYIDDTHYITTVNKFDFADRPVEIINPDSTQTTTAYYKNGVIKQSTDANSKSTYFIYDGLNRLVGKWIPFEQNGSSVMYAYSEYTYDKAGRKTLEKTGKTLVQLYGKPDQYISVACEYYDDGNLKTLIDAGRKKEYQYDDNGLLSTEKDYYDATHYNTIEYINNYWGKPDTKNVYVRKGDISGYSFSDDDSIALTTNYSYDDNGNVKSETSPNGVITTYTYDNLNRQTGISQPGIDEYGTAVTISVSQGYNYMGNVVSHTDAKGNITTNEYNGRGFLIKVIDANDGVSLNFYDWLGRETAKVSPLNYIEGRTLAELNRTEFSYDPMGRMKTMSQTYYDNKTSQWVSYVANACKYDNNGNKIKELDSLGYAAGAGASVDDKINSGYGIESVYNLANLLVSVLDPVCKDASLGYTTKFGYDALGSKITETNANNNITNYYLDDAGNILSIKVRKDSSSPEQAVQVNTYDLLGNVLTTTDGNGNTTTYQNNALGKQRQVTYPFDTTIPEYVVCMQYDKVGNLVYTFDNNEVENFFTYDNQGRQLSHKEQKNDDTDIITTNIAYDKNGNQRFETDGNGHVRENVFDELNRISSTKISVSGIDQTTSFTYDDNGNQLTSVDWLSNVSTNEYDPLNRLIAKKDANNVVVERLAYNNNDTQTSSTDALGNVTLFTYDKNKRLLTTEDSGHHISGKTYDYVGNIESQYDGRNNTTWYQYDEFNRLVKVTNPKNEETAFTYDLNGNMLTQTDGRGYVKIFEYNAANMLIRSIDHGGRTGEPGDYTYNLAKTVSYSYDKNGNMHTMVDRNGNTTTYNYDIHSRMLTQTIGSISISYTYDGNGNQLTVIDSTGITTRTYDELNRVLTKNVPVIGTVTYVYDITVGLSGGYSGEQSTDPADNVVLKVYDKVGRLYSVTEGTNETVYSYYDNGARESVTYESGVREEYQYLEDNLMSLLINRKPDGTLMDMYIYTYDEAHNQETKYEIVSNVEKGTTEYTYDSLNRLFAVTEPDDRLTEYNYDEAGNRVGETITESALTRNNVYSFNSQNRLTSFEARLNGEVQYTNEYTYDNNGNNLTVSLTPYVEGISQTPEVEVTNEYDMLNQLVQTVKGSTTTVNSYNGEGLRTAKSVNSVTTHYLYEYNKIVLETDNNGDETAFNVYGLNLLMRSTCGESFYYLYNGHADVTALIDADTSLISATYYYDAFGNILESTGNVNNNIRYTGYQFDSETGYYYLNARMYDPKVARFLQEDTFAGDPNDPLSLNLYTYCRNNPLVYIDPTGHRYATEDNGSESVASNVNTKPKKEKSGWEKFWSEDFWKPGDFILEEAPKFAEKVVKGAYQVGQDVKEALGPTGDVLWGIGEGTVNFVGGIINNAVDTVNVVGNYIRDPLSEGKKFLTNVRNDIIDLPNTLRNLPGNVETISRNFQNASLSDQVAMGTELLLNAALIFTPGPDELILLGNVSKAARAIDRVDDAYDFVKGYNRLDDSYDAYRTYDKARLRRARTYEGPGKTGKGMNNSNTRNAANMGNKVHYDELNGGKGQGLPTELSQKYPETEFEFSRRGQAGVDVKVVGGKHPSQYPDSTWNPGNDYADFKPGTASGQKTFQSDINKGKVPANSEYLPYDPQTGHLK